jgi:SAM-dependent methyltransferase
MLRKITDQGVRSALNMIPSETGRGIRAEPRSHCYVCDSVGEPLYHGLRDRINRAPGVWSISRCPNSSCGLMWLDPMPLEEDIGEAYRTYYTHGAEPAAPGDEMRQFIGADFRKPSSLRRLLPRLGIGRAYLASAYAYTNGVFPWQRLLGYGLYLQPFRVRDLARSIGYLKACPGGALLDVGCGDGQFLARMQALRWNVEGLDVDERAVVNARKQGLNVRCGRLHEIGFTDNLFDAIVLNHVLEHVHDPESLLRECHRVLRPGGQFRAFVPNAGGVGQRRFGRDWGGLDPPRHLYHFTAQALTGLGARAGFRVRVRASSAIDRYLYRASYALASQSQMRDSVWSRLRLCALDYRDSLGILIGKDWGEELMLWGEKA